MLSIAPPASEYLAEMSEWQSASVRNESVVVASAIAGVKPEDAPPLFLDKEIENVELPSPWQDLPWPHQYVVPQVPNGPPQFSGPNGYSDIGELADLDSPALFEGTTMDQEARSLLELLSQLKYLPNDSRANTTDRDVRHEAEFAERQDVNRRLIHMPAGIPSGVGNIPVPPFTGERSEGGMVSIIRETVIEESALMEVTPVAAVDSLLESAVQMDSAYGKFQAFEVSTEEESTPPSPAPESQGAKTNSPMNDSAEAVHMAALEFVLNSSAAIDTIGPLLREVDQDPARVRPTAKDIASSDAETESKNEDFLPSQYDVAAALGIALVTCATRAVIPNADERQNMAHNPGVANSTKWPSGSRK
jgi:hypothetical protein